METKPRMGVLAIQGDFAAHRAAFARLGCETAEVRRPADLEAADGLILPGGETTTLIKILKDTGLWEGILSFAGQGRPVFGTCAGLILLAGEVTDPPQPCFGLLDVTVQRNAYGRQVDSFEVPGVLRVPKDLRRWMRRNGVPAEGAGEAPPAPWNDESAATTATVPPAADPSGEPTPAQAPSTVDPSAQAPSAVDPSAQVSPAEASMTEVDPGIAEVATEFVFIRAPKILRVGEEVEVLARHDGSPILVRQGHLLGASFHPELAAQGIVERLFLAMLAQASAVPSGGNGRGGARGTGHDAGRDKDPDTGCGTGRG